MRPKGKLLGPHRVSYVPVIYLSRLDSTPSKKIDLTACSRMRYPMEPIVRSRRENSIHFGPGSGIRSGSKRWQPHCSDSSRLSPLPCDCGSSPLRQARTRTHPGTSAKGRFFVCRDFSPFARALARADQPLTTHKLEGVVPLFPGDGNSSGKNPGTLVARTHLGFPAFRRRVQERYWVTGVRGN
jgi:hypothetical protein